MASIKPTLESDTFISAMVNTLSDDIRAALKEPLMKQAEAYVDEAVDKALEAIKPHIEAAVNQFDMETTVKFIIERRSIDAKA